MFRNTLTKLYLKRIERKGFKHGKNFNLEKGANIDSAFCSLISCGDNVTLTKDVYILAHDASMKKFLGKTKVGSVQIGSNVFIGAKTVVLPGVSIGDNVIAYSGDQRIIAVGKVIKEFYEEKDKRSVK
jgi:maltose O-acetyltransferase